jgi:hypothetical protein
MYKSENPLLFEYIHKSLLIFKKLKLIFCPSHGSYIFGVDNPLPFCIVHFTDVYFHIISRTPASAKPMISFSKPFAFYPRMMVNLCNLAYDDISVIPSTVSRYDPDLSVVWGPAELVKNRIPYSLLYVAKRASTNEYTVVIRGTNFESLSSWLLQDFAISALQPFNKLAPTAPATALISQGTFNGLSDLIEAVDPVTQKSVADFFVTESPAAIYVTGHSLGGTLTPVMLAYLNDMLNGGKPLTNMWAFSFAGLTPGNEGFNAYFNALLGDNDYAWRFYNTLDLAPMCWVSASEIETAYAPHGLHSSFLETDPVNKLFAEAAGKGYAQPEGRAMPLQGIFAADFADDHMFPLQALHQHRIANYIALVGQAFPG